MSTLAILTPTSNTVILSLKVTATVAPLEEFKLSYLFIPHILESSYHLF